MKASFNDRVAVTPSPREFIAPAQTAFLQRLCACGSASATGGCEECKNKSLSGQRYSANWTGPSGPLHSLTPTPSHSGYDSSGGQVLNRLPDTVQTKGEVGQPGDPFEQEADRMAEQFTRVSFAPAWPDEPTIPLSRSEPLIQRLPVDGAGTSDLPSAIEARTDSAEQNASAGLIVEDDAAELAAGQMRKSAFLDELRTSVCSIADAVLLAVGQTTEGCPYIERWIGYYRTRSSQQVERALHRYVPEAAGVSAASDYIPLVAERVRQAVIVWARTGEVTGVPAGLSAETPETSPNEPATGSAAPTDQPQSPATGSVMTKGRDGFSREVNEPQRIQSRLSAGRPLDSDIRSRMGSVFGHDFSRVRVHTDAQANRLSDHLNARAFTIGHNVAFASGEYKPGTLFGDALIAHELAHVVQQSGGTSTVAPRPNIETGHDVLEEEADVSAVGAVVALWGKATAGLKQLARNVKPHLRSGLQLKRCRSGCSITPTATCHPGDFAGIKFDLSNAIGRSAANPAEIVPRTDSRGNETVWFHAVDPPHYHPSVKICAPDDTTAMRFVGGLIQNVLSVDRRAIYDNGTVVSTEIPGLPIRDGVRSGDILHDDILMEEGTMFRPLDNNTVSLNLGDRPEHEVPFHLRDHPTCYRGTDARLSRVIVHDTFRTWTAVKRSGEHNLCVAKLHHINWNIDWEGTVSPTGPLTPAALTRVRGGVNVTLPNGNGSETALSGDPVANLSSVQRCGPASTAPLTPPATPQSPQPRSTPSEQPGTRPRRD